MFRWALRGAVGYDELALNGFLLLAERLRSPEERTVVRQVRLSRPRAGTRCGGPGRFLGCVWVDLSLELCLQRKDLIPMTCTPFVGGFAQQGGAPVIEDSSNTGVSQNIRRPDLELSHCRA